MYYYFGPLQKIKKRKISEKEISYNPIIQK